jgi:hypothetical protein
MKIKEMRALTIVQPNAAILMKDGEGVEERSWNTHTRGFIAIHASSSYKPERFEGKEIDPDELDYGAIVGFAKLEEVEGEPGDYVLCFGEVIKLKEPVEAKGMMNLWKISGKELNQCLSQLSQTQMKRLLS